ncbi:MAG: amino acid ABC transporter substrate-binding protein [candidate division NC10 bacterium]|nr:amino acid ABC transporter substrate-binding protein [candidate division NC10 bacterium]
MSGQLVSRGGLLGGVGVLAALLLVVPASAQQPPVKLAIVAEITGGGAAVGAMWRDGINLAVEDINKKGGVLGRRLETFVMDTQTDPPTSVAVMRRAFNEQPFVIMGTVYSSSTVANMDIVRQAGIPQISGSESVLLIQKGNPNIFLTAFTQQIGMAKQVRWLVEDLKADKIALVYVNNAFGRGGREMFLKFVKDRGKTVVADISTEPQQADFTAELTRVRASGATHLMVYNHEEENARLMIQLRKLGMSVEAVGETTLCAQTAIDPGGEAMNGAKCHVGMTAASTVPSMVDVNRRFQQKYGKVPDHNAFKAYIGTHMLKAAVQRVGAFDQAKLRDCLHNNLFTVDEEPGLPVGGEEGRHATV